MLKIFLISIFIILSGCVQPDPSALLSGPLPDSTTESSNVRVLIYGGPGSWKAEVNSIKKILFNHDVGYDVLTPAQINALSERELTHYTTMIFAGGDAPTVQKSLTAETRARLRKAVQEDGMSYLGFCAGAWLAVAPAPGPGESDVVYGIGVVNGPVGKQTRLFQQGLHYALDRARFPDGKERNLLWYGGPITPDIPGGVVAKYSDGTPAITQIRSGKGFVVISGFHPAANQGILNSVHMNDAEAIAPDFAWALLQATIFKKNLPAFP